MGKTALFLVACVTLVQRSSGYTTFSSILFSGSFYLDNQYTGLVQSVVLASVIISLSMVLTADFLLRGGMVEKPSEKFYRFSGVVTVLFGVVMILLSMFTIPSYSYYPLTGLSFYYTQQVMLYAVGSFDLIGVYFLILGCVIISFQRNPPLIKRYQLIAGSILTMVAFPLVFVSVQLFIERYIFYSSLLASLDIDALHGIFPLNFNLYTYISLILFTIGICVYTQNSKIKTVILIGFIIYVYFYPGFYRVVLLTYYMPTPTPDVPILIYLGLAIVAAVISVPTIPQEQGWGVINIVRRVLKPSARNVAALLVILAILIPILFMNARVTSIPSTQAPVTSQGLSAVDKIDPRLLNISNSSFPQNVSVILRFMDPIPQSYIDGLKNTTYSAFFTFENYSGTDAVYQDNAYYAIYGNVSANDSSDLGIKLVQLVNDFHLSYILFNQNPSTPPDIYAHDARYYFVGADILQSFNITGKGTTVAVIDSGIDWYVPVISGKTNGRVIYQVNFLTGQAGDPRILGEPTTLDPSSHGTGIALDTAGVYGIAPDADIIDLKIKTDSGEAFYMTCVHMAEALDWCVANKDLFNISAAELALGNENQVYGFLTEAVDRAFLDGIVVVVAGGGYLDFSKNHVGGLLVPGIADWAITVGATMSIKDSSWSPVSPLGPSPHWWLPKPEVTGPGPYTSGSVPTVTGIALLLTQEYNEMGLPPALRAASIRWAIIAGAQEHDLGPPGWDPQYGYGLANELSSFLYLTNHLQI
ncbi:MAG: S8 family serine peptidase [Candidatus Freyarchaeum deiterrae]